jgi:hypothetical protein
MNYDDLQGLRELEELMEGLPAESVERKKLSKLVLARRRELKGRAEAVLATADFYDKAAVPMGAAVPGAASLLVTTGAFDDPHKIIIAVSSVIGALFWGVLRIMALKASVSARRELAQLGKVD